MNKYHYHKISYTLNNEKKSINYWNSLPLTKDLLVIIIFAKEFGTKYNKERERAEECLVKLGECSYVYKDVKYQFSDISFELLEERKMKNPAFARIRRSQKFSKNKKPKELNRCVDNLFVDTYVSRANYN